MFGGQAIDWLHSVAYCLTLYSLGIDIQVAALKVSFTIPVITSSSPYLVRVVSIALHVAQSEVGAQLYLSYAQIEVTKSGQGNTGPLVSFLGHVVRTDLGMLIGI